MVDTRSAIDFAGAHLRGAINIGIDGKYATWAGTMLDRETPIVVIADDDRLDESVMRLGRIGFDHVNGVLKDGMDALRDRSDLLSTTHRITAPALQERLQADSADLTVIDIRSASEYQAGHVPGSINLPLGELKNRLSEIPSRGDVVIHCAGGYRSSIAASLLQQQGMNDVWDLVGGFKAWVQSGGEIALPAEGAGTSA